MNATQVLGSLAFQVGILSGDVAHGAAICLFLFPFLLVAVVLTLRVARRREL
jgi:multiple sugar transport system permease protein